MTSRLSLSAEPLDYSDESEDESGGVPVNAVKRQSKRRRWLGWLPLLLLPVAGIAAYAMLRPTSELVPEISVLPVETIAVESVSSYRVQRSYTGEIVARRRSDLGFERAGTVVQILVDEGDRVSAGTPLARLDTRGLRAQRQELLAQKSEAQAKLQELRAGPRSQVIDAARSEVADLDQQLELARLQAERRQSLYEEGAISREALDRETFNQGALKNRRQAAQSRLDELLAGTRSEQVTAQRARVQQLNASIVRLDVDLSKSTLYAPFAGKVSDRVLDEGTVASNGTPVLSLIEQGALEARIGIPSDQAAQLTLGSRQTLQVGGQRYAAQLTALLPEVDEASRTVTAVLQLNGEGAPLRAGQTARLLMEESQETEGFWLPSTALVPSDRGLWSAYVLGEPGEQSDTYNVARRDVEVLHTAGDRVLVRGTLQPDDLAIANGTHRIVADQLVRLAP